MPVNDAVGVVVDPGSHLGNGEQLIVTSGGGLSHKIVSLRFIYNMGWRPTCTVLRGVFDASKT
jgi:hypothetical protein